MSIMGLNRSDWTQAYRVFRIALRNRYLGSRMGLLWAILNPLLMLSLYIFVFGYLFKSPADTGSNSLEYVRWFVCGFSPWMAISDGLVYTTVSVTSSVQMVKTFPIKTELLPIAYSAMGAPQLAVGLVAVLILSFVTGAGVSLQLLWLLAAVPLTFAFLAGAGFFLAAINVFIRDISQIIGTLLMFVMFFTPIFYRVESLPQFAQTITFFNPIFQIINTYRRIMIDQISPDFLGLGYLALFTLLLWLLGLLLFRRLKGFFESML